MSTEPNQDAQSAQTADVRATAAAVFRTTVQADVTEAYDRTDDALRAADKYAPDVARDIEAARDLLFRARVALDETP